MARDLLVYDSEDRCPYLPGRIARMPLRMPTSPLSPEELDIRLAAGERRSGRFMYRPECATCKACEAIRIEASGFVPRRTQRRVLNKGDRVFSVEIGKPLMDNSRVDLFNLHRDERDLTNDDGDVGEDGYQMFLVDSCCDTFEMVYRLNDETVCVSICDRGRISISAVYCYFDPKISALSPGVYSILKQIELCRAWGLRYLYLGLYVAESKHMSYKSRFTPHERLINGNWRVFDAGD